MVRTGNYSDAGVEGIKIPAVTGRAQRSVTETVIPVFSWSQSSSSTGFRPEIPQKAQQTVSLVDLMLRHSFLKTRPGQPTSQ